MESARRPDRDRTPLLRTPLVGRAAELRLLQDLADRTVEIGAEVVFVSGEAGIGKSTLVSHLLADLTQKRWRTYVGRCVEYSDRAIPFGPIVSLIRAVLNDAGREAEAILGHHRADLSQLLPEWRVEGADRPDASLNGDVDRLVDAISTVLIRAAERRPIAVFVEDIHWSDSPTRDVIASLVHSLGPAKILLLVSERTGAVPRGHPLRTWLAEQRRFANVSTLALSGLSPAALAEQATHILGEQPDQTLVAELVDRTGGNAYFASELLLARRSGEVALPHSLADFLTSRLEQLQPGEQEVLRALAVAGEGINHRVLAAALPHLDIGPPLRRLFDAVIVTVEGADYDFGHALMREAMLRRILPFEGEELHRRIAEAIEADSDSGHSLGDLTTLARHWTGANDPERSMVAAVKASVASARVAAYEPAAELALDALRAWPKVKGAERLTETTRDALAAEASDWLTLSNQSERAAELLVGALDTWAADLPDGRRALLLARLSLTRFENGRPEEATSLLDEAVELVADEVSPEAAYVHHRVSKLALLKAKIEPAMAAADRAIEIAGQVGPELILVEALSTKALGIGVTQSLDAGIELLRESRRRAMDKSFVSQAAQTFRIEMMIINFNEGRTPRSHEVLREGFEFATKHCGPSLRLDFLNDRALSLVESGSLIEAAPLLETLADHRGQNFRSLAALQTTALSNLLAGDCDGADRMLSEARQLADRFTAQELGFQHRLESELARNRGQFDEALQLIDNALELQIVRDNVTFTRESILEKCRLIRAISKVDPARAAGIRPEVERLIDGLDFRNRASAWLTNLMRLELALADGTARADEVGRLVVQRAASGFGADAKRTALIHAQLLASERPGSPELVEALVVLHSLGRTSGMLLLSTGAEEIASNLGIDLVGQTSTDMPKGSSETPDGAESSTAVPADDRGLTPREIEVLGCLARGLTNKEIGVELYVSHRTVGAHVSNLLAKLHLKNRSEAAAKYHELGFANARR